MERSCDCREFAGVTPRPQVPPPPAFRASLDQLREVSDRMRDPSGQQDVLSLVLEYASAQFARVAVFMLRGDTAVADEMRLELNRTRWVFALGTVPPTPDQTSPIDNARNN